MRRLLLSLVLLLACAGCFTPGEDYGYPFIIEDYMVDADRLVSLRINRRQGAAIVTIQDAAAFVATKLSHPGRKLVPLERLSTIPGDRRFTFVVLDATAPSTLEPAELRRLSTAALRMDMAVMLNKLRGAF